jgi:DNA-binding MltR family transcriptional regulator
MCSTVTLAQLLQKAIRLLCDGVFLDFVVICSIVPVLSVSGPPSGLEIELVSLIGY